MSLINDMLKDLDQRNYQLAGASGAALSGLGRDNINLNSPLTQRFRFVRNTGVVIAVLLAGFALSSTLRFQQTQAPIQSRLEPAIIPMSQLPVISPSSIVEPDLDKNNNKAHNTIQPNISPTEKSNPRLGAANVKASASRGPMTANDMESDSSTYIEVTHRPLSAEQQLLSDFHVASETYKEGDFVETEKLLQDLLVRDDSMHHARMLLARLYTTQKLDSRAESILSNALLIYPQNAPYVSLYAQILAAQGRDGEAIDALQNALPGVGENADIHALLAGLYQRTDNSAAAAESYMVALRLEPSHGEWWMGLGISSEQAGDSDTAIYAYNEALQHPLTSLVEKYAEQRLQQLAAKETTDESQDNN